MTQKNIISRIIALAFFVLCTATLVAQDDDPHPLEGTWTFLEAPSVAKMPAGIKAQLDTVPQLRTQVMETYRGRKLAFAADGGFVQTMPGGTQITGTWSASGNELVVNIQGQEVRQVVGLLTVDRLVLLLPEAGEAKAMFPEIHYTKTDL